MTMINEFNQPGVSFTQQLINLSRRPRESALPVFIGYTPPKATADLRQLCSVRSLQDYQDQFGEEYDGYYLFRCLSLYFGQGGGECFVISLGEITAGLTPSVDDYLGVFDLVLDEPAITLLAMPDMVKLSSDNWKVLVDLAGKACTESLNLFALIDYPRDPEEVETCNKLPVWTGEHLMAGYWPWVYHHDGQSILTHSRLAQLTPSPPSGAIAAVMQQTDRDRGVWKAPANIRLSQAIRPAFSHLYAFKLFHANPTMGRSVNQIRSFPGRGVLVWGCRTLSANGDIRQLYVQNRRLVNWLKANLSEALQPFVFEQNNEITWFRIKALIRRNLKALWEKGGLIGATEDDAYRIWVGQGESMTDEDMDNGLLRIRVDVSTHRPAEFIHINLDFYINSAQSIPLEGLLTRSAPQ